MKHLSEAHRAQNSTQSKYTQILAPNKVEFIVQDGPIKEVGVNGLQASDILHFTLELFKSLNAEFPCRENSLTITKVEEALHWQDARTKNRIERGVEGKNEA